MCDRTTCGSVNVYNSISFLALSHHISGDICTYCWPHLYTREQRKVLKERNKCLSLSSSDKCMTSDHGQEAGREMNNLRDAAYNAENVKQQTMKTA